MVKAQWFCGTLDASLLPQLSCSLLQLRAFRVPGILPWFMAAFSDVMEETGGRVLAPSSSELAPGFKRFSIKIIICVN